MKKFFNWFKSTSNHKYINGGKGIISIFLALIMVPFASLADLLVETARYKASKTALEEIIDSSIYSTLSHYDRYLQDRFGLLAIDQSINMNNTFNNYLLANTKSMTTWNIDENDINVTGLYPLSENKALMNQICEISKYSAPASIAGSVLSEILDNFKGLKQVTNIFNLVGSVGDSFNSLKTLANDLEDLKNMSQAVNNAVSTYRVKFHNFANAVENLAGKISDYEEKKNRYDAALEEISKSNESINMLKNEQKDLEEKIEELKEAYNKNQKKDKNQYEKDLKTMEKNLADKKKNIEDIIDSLNKDNKTLKNDKAEMEKAESKIAGEKNAVNTAKADYESAISDLAGKLQSYSNKADTVLADCESVGTSTVGLTTNITKTAEENKNNKYKNDNDYEGLKQKKSEAEKKLSEAKDQSEKDSIQKDIDSYTTQIESIETNVNANEIATQNVIKCYNDSVDAINNTSAEMQEALKDHNKDKIGNCITNLNTLKNNVGKYDTDSVHSNTIISMDYYVSIPPYATTDAIQNALDKAKDELYTDGGFDSVKALINIFKTLTSCDSVFNPQLNAYISEDTGYTPTDLDLVLNSMTKMIQSVGDISDGFGSLNIFKMLEGICNLCTSIFEFSKNLVNYLLGLVTRIVQCLGEIASSKVGDKILLDEYLLRNLSNRTNMNNIGKISGKAAFTGYNFSDIEFDESSSVNAIPGIGDLAALIDILKDVSTGGSNQMFCGAELEYILIGSKSEILNQTAVFFQLYFIRMLLDLPAVLSNAEVEGIASAVSLVTAGVGGHVVKLVIALIEPFLDTLTLVNGGKIPIYKSYVFVTPSGCPKLIKNFSYLKLTQAQEDKIKNECKDNLNFDIEEDHSGKDYGMGLTYDQYLLVLMLFTGENNEYLNRFRNLVQLESRAYYNEISKPFDIKNSYTFLDVNVSGEFVPILPLGDIIYNNLFHSTQKEIRGY